MMMDLSLSWKALVKAQALQRSSDVLRLMHSKSRCFLYHMMTLADRHQHLEPKTASK